MLSLLGQHGRHDYRGEPPAQNLDPDIHKPDLVKMFKDFSERFKTASFTRVQFMRSKTEGDEDSDEEEDASEDEDEALIVQGRSRRLRVLRSDSCKFLEFFYSKKNLLAEFEIYFITN